MNTSSKRQAAQGRHAVVLGGSLAGLLAARVLSDHFDEVTLIERDVLAETPEVRRGIPQANHVHGLLLRGREVLEEFFPGLQDEMIADGVPLIRVLAHVLKERKLHENADRNHGRERQVGGRQKVSENRLVS